MALEFLYEIFNGIVVAISNALGPWNDYPLATITILLLTILMSTISTVATRMLVDVDVMRRRNLEMREWQSAYSKALRAKDEKTVAKLKKREPAVKRAQAEMSKDQFKPLLVTMVPFFIFYYIFSAVFGYNQVVVAYSPISIPFVGEQFNFWVWYLISSFSMSAFIQRLFKMPTYSD
ncbi:MAG TPA: EMC3/TMCO1 family protein [Candidatus Methanomethylicus sp.]|jgi:uncharacterized membrane protein (DUF106 family)|nr:EMC3/TMCO1 family protein [Candidatus Methanomethylicus sp.]